MVQILVSAVVVACFVALSEAQTDNFVCPHDYGFYGHALSCDKYWACDQGVPTLRTCGNGLAFVDTDPQNLKEDCDYLHNVECGLRTDLQSRVSRSVQSFECPRADGFFAHSEQCDAYWRCINWKPTLRLCGNGLAFDNDREAVTDEHCDYLFAVDCSDRLLLEPPISTPHCDYLHGIFPDPEKCEVFWSCWAGEATRYECGPGLAYSRVSRTCSWMDKVPECQRQRSEQNALTGIECPASGAIAALGSFSRHAHPDDCRLFFVCFDGTPREYGCPIGTVFMIGESDGLGQCSDPKLVPGCEDYYGDIDISVLKTLGLKK